MANCGSGGLMLVNVGYCCDMFFSWYHPRIKCLLSIRHLHRKTFEWMACMEFAPQVLKNRFLSHLLDVAC